MQVYKRELILPDTTEGKRERDTRLAIVTLPPTMSELLLKLDIGFVIVAVDGCVVNARSSILVIDDNFAIFIMTILQLLY